MLITSPYCNYYALRIAYITRHIAQVIAEHTRAAPSHVRCEPTRSKRMKSCPSDQDHLDLILQVLDLRVQLRTLLRSNRARNHWPGHAARSAKCGLRLDEDARDVFVLANQWQVKQDLQWLGVSSEDDELCRAAVQRLRGLVGSFLQLLIVRRLLHKVEDGHGKVLLR